MRFIYQGWYQCVIPHHYWSPHADSFISTGKFIDVIIVITIRAGSVASTLLAAEHHHPHPYPPPHHHHLVSQDDNQHYYNNQNNNLYRENHLKHFVIMSLSLDIFESLRWNYISYNNILLLLSLLHDKGDYGSLQPLIFICLSP